MLKRLYNLLDVQMGYQLLDLTTIWHFKNHIGVIGAETLFATVDQQILQHSYVARGVQIFEATLVLSAAPKQHFSSNDKEQIKENSLLADWSSAKRCQKDLDATWTEKHGKKSTYGFKFSISVDRKHKLIHKRVADTVSIYDSQHFETVLEDWNNSAEIWGYPSQVQEERFKNQGYRRRIQRKCSCNHPLSECQQRRNHKIAKVRGRVEHVLSSWSRGVASVSGPSARRGPALR